MPKATQVAEVIRTESDDVHPVEPLVSVDDLAREITTLVGEVLKLDYREAQTLRVDTPLFEQGLGMDSIDLLQLATAVKRRYGVETASDEERNREVFRSIGALADHVRRSLSRSTTG